MNRITSRPEATKMKTNLLRKIILLNKLLKPTSWLLCPIISNDKTKTGIKSIIGLRINAKPTAIIRIIPIRFLMDVEVAYQTDVARTQNFATYDGSDVKSFGRIWRYKNMSRMSFSYKFFGKTACLKLSLTILKNVYNSKNEPSKIKITKREKSREIGF
jgi:hypothetical protein